MAGGLSIISVIGLVSVQELGDFKAASFHSACAKKKRKENKKELRSVQGTCASLKIHLGAGHICPGCGSCSLFN